MISPEQLDTIDVNLPESTIKTQDSRTNVSIKQTYERGATSELDEALSFPTVVAQGSIDVHSPKGAVLFSTLVSPLNFSTYSLTSRISYIARLFAQWTGTMRIHIVFTKVIFQQLKLIVAYHPGIHDIKSFDVWPVESLAGLQYSKIFNPANEDELVFDIPFIFPSLWCDMSGNSGCLSIRIFQQLVTSQSDTNLIYWTMRISRPNDKLQLKFRNVLPADITSRHEIDPVLQTISNAASPNPSGVAENVVDDNRDSMVKDRSLILVPRGVSTAEYYGIRTNPMLTYDFYSPSALFGSFNFFVASVHIESSSCSSLPAGCCAASIMTSGAHAFYKFNFPLSMPLEQFKSIKWADTNIYWPYLNTVPNLHNTSIVIAEVALDPRTIKIVDETSEMPVVEVLTSGTTIGILTALEVGQQFHMCTYLVGQKEPKLDFLDKYFSQTKAEGILGYSRLPIKALQSSVAARRVLQVNVKTPGVLAMTPSRIKYIRGPGFQGPILSLFFALMLKGAVAAVCQFVHEISAMFYRTPNGVLMGSSTQISVIDLSQDLVFKPLEASNWNGAFACVSSSPKATLFAPMQAVSDLRELSILSKIAGLDERKLSSVTASVAGAATFVEWYLKINTTHEFVSYKLITNSDNNQYLASFVFSMLEQGDNNVVFTFTSDSFSYTSTVSLGRSLKQAVLVFGVVYVSSYSNRSLPFYIK